MDSKIEKLCHNLEKRSFAPNFGFNGDLPVETRLFHNPMQQSMQGRS